MTQPLNPTEPVQPSNPAPAQPAQPADVPQAQGAAITMTKEQLDAAIASGAAKVLADAKDSIYAEARRTFTAGKDKPKNAEAAQPAADPIRLRTLDRELSRAGLADLDEVNYGRVERLFAEENPGDVTAWVRSLPFGRKDSPAPAAPVTIVPAQAPAQPQNAQPASDRGSPAPVKPPLEEADLVSMSDSDRTALIKAKGLRWYHAKIGEQMKGRRVALR